ncbi:NAD(+) diphosphatase [Novosphingobium mangrovi (ex Huang et al. 2023)]|uniref:NAD(+) diphosphatase n=1 Tax=Novosphingobium mangrovi (ex Huang et al. 2023) TaxID=2976432 RepID=A0ABT2I0B5_9SPHN|nr:NAD(+) diphosphatase [Novosphingobium mangrovi (ex Huang et al. 2023)]MCT2398242.1 NAD(+) diphosphatase [Novosphingobium mangrovi (ex Huang et al. 2023)]
MHAPIAFSGSHVDRADHIRNDPAALDALKTWQARLLRMDGLDPVLTLESTLDWGSLADAAPDSELVFLGLDGERGCFAEVRKSYPSGSPHAGPASWNAMAVLEAGELAAYGGARSLVGWHSRHRFCAVCGSATVLAKGGWQRNCTNADCKAEHFPRVDPVTIMTVECDGKLLLGRQPRFPAGRYSALAGFVEPGETIEEAVAREVFEEAGVRARDVEYVISQPWPFPSSLMIGCHAFADDPAIVMDETEMEDVRWFTREEVTEALEATERGEQGRAFGAPPKTAVAHALLRWWVARGA